MADLLNGYVQHAPFLIEIEPTEGCNLGCSFCGLRGIRERGTEPYKFMTVDEAESIAKKCAASHYDRGEVTFCGHGEPTLNPHLLDIIRVFRKHLPKAVFTVFTNGYGFRHGIFEINHFVRTLRELKVCDFRIDVYSPKGDWQAVYDLEDYEAQNVKTLGKDGESLNYRGKEMRIVLYPMDVGSMKTYFRRFDNHCGAAAPLDYSKVNIRCHKPFRYMFIRWNGMVCLCCDDFRGQYQIANVHDYEHLEDVWNHERFQAARIMLYNGKRTFRPCYGCNNSPVRAGLIPDPSGRDKNVIPEPNADVARVLAEAYHEEGSTTIFKRKWEIEQE